MSGVGGVGSSDYYYSLFAQLYGTEAAEKAKEAGLFDELVKGEKSWDDIIKWAEEQGYQRGIHEPDDDYDPSGAKNNIFNQYYDVAVLFHQICRQIRRTRREDTFLMQQKIVEVLKDAASKKREAADKLDSAALKVFVLTMVAAGVGVLGAAASFASAAKAISNAVNKASEEAMREITKELAKAAKDAVQKNMGKVVDESAKAAAKVAKEIAKEVAETGAKAGKEVTGRVLRESVKQSQKAAENVMRGVLKETLKDTNKVVDKAVNNALKQATKGLGKGAAQKVRERLETVLRNHAEKAAKEMTEKLTQNLPKTVANTTAREVTGASSKALKVMGEGSGKFVDKEAQAIAKSVAQEVTKEMEKSIAAIQKAVIKSMSGKWNAVYLGATALSQGSHGLGDYYNTEGQSASQVDQAEADKINAAAEQMKGMERREEEDLSEINDTLRNIQQKLDEFEAARAKQWEAAASI